MKPMLLKRLLAGLAGLGLVALLLWVSTLFLGNPLEAARARRAIEAHLQQNYPGWPLGADGLRYDFKTGGYLLRVQSAEHVDCHFAVYYRSDGTVTDDYQSYVPTGWNTLLRWGEELTAQIAPLLRERYGEELTGRCMLQLPTPTPGEEPPPLDAPLDLAACPPATLYLDFTVEEPTLAALADRARAAYRIVTEAGCPVASVTVEVTDKGRHSGYLAGIDAAWMEEEQLPQRLEEQLQEGAPFDETLQVFRVKG